MALIKALSHKIQGSFLPRQYSIMKKVLIACNASISLLLYQPAKPKTQCSNGALVPSTSFFNYGNKFYYFPHNGHTKMRHMAEKCAVVKSIPATLTTKEEFDIIRKINGKERPTKHQ